MKQKANSKTNKNTNSLSHLVIKMTKYPLDNVDVVDFSRFAKAVWYETEDAVLKLEHRLKTPNLPPVRKRRLLYLVDRLRRFPCLTKEHASELKSFVYRWESLANSVNSKVANRAAKKNRYDKLAVNWGLEEDVSCLMSKVLEFQTRHYVDEHFLPSGYDHLNKKNSTNKSLR